MQYKNEVVRPEKIAPKKGRKKKRKEDEERKRQRETNTEERGWVVLVEKQWSVAVNGKTH